MGIFFYVKSVALIEDIPLNEKYDKMQDLINDMDNGFAQVQPSHPQSPDHMSRIPLMRFRTPSTAG